MMRNTIGTNLDITAGILRKIQDVNPGEKQAILLRHEKSWRAKEEPKNTLKAIFTSTAFWNGVKAPLLFVSHLLQPKFAKRTDPEILDVADSFDGYARELCKAIREHLNENPAILNDIHLNDRERDLIGLPHRSPNKWADENAYPAEPTPQI